MAGGVLLLRHELTEVIHEGFTKLKEENADEVRNLVRRKHGDAEVSQFVCDTEVLRQSAFLFTSIWLDDLLPRLLDPQLPRMRNSDGDEIAFTTVGYPLNAAIDRRALEEALATIPGFHRAGDDLWNWGAHAAPARPEIPHGARTFVSTFDDGSVSMGSVKLEAKALKLETNSPQRAQRGRALLDPVITPFVGEPVVESKTTAELMASRPANVGRIQSPLSPGEERAVVHEMLERHYRGLLDQPVPMLGNVSPRTAAKTENGQERLVDWLKLLENSTARQEAGSAMAAYDIGWMWNELGIANRRR
jgi:hypothetical protein